MKKLYVLGLLLMMTVGVAAILKLGYKPVPIGIMKPSFFATAEEIGIVVFRRFYSPIIEKKLVFIGVPPQPDWNLEIVHGMLRAASAEKVPFEVVIAEAQMPGLDFTGLPPVELVTIHTNSDTLAELVDQIQRVTKEGKRTLVYLPSVFSTHLLANNVVNRLEAITGQNYMTITTTPLALKADQEFLVDPPCVGDERDANGTASLGCVVLQSGRMTYRKKLPQDRFVAMMNSPQREDYLLMISFPNQGADAGQSNKDLRMKPPGGIRTGAR
jgi:hypothetical protein